MYTIRNLSLYTRKAILDHSKEYDLTIAESLQQLVEFGLEHLEQQKKNPKKFLNTEDAIKKMPEW